ncbi:MAG: cytochrome c oxidase subunit II transmembrane domain-containing protein [Hyphomonadaceae bacterium]
MQRITVKPRFHASGWRMWSNMRRGAWKHWALGAASLMAGGTAWATPVPGGIDFQTPVTETAKKVHAFHTEVLVIITAIVIFVTALLLWVMIRYNKKANPTPKKFSHNTMIEIIWTVAPVLILVWIAKSSFPLLYEHVQGRTTNGDVAEEAGRGHQGLRQHVVLGLHVQPEHRQGIHRRTSVC